MARYQSNVNMPEVKLSELIESGNALIYNNNGTVFKINPDAVEGRLIIDMPITKLGDMALADCDKLREVVLPDSLQTIGAGTFMGCKNLESIEIPDNIKNIGSNAFKGCDSLQDLHIGLNSQVNLADDKLPQAERLHLHTAEGEIVLNADQQKQLREEYEANKDSKEVGAEKAANKEEMKSLEDLVRAVSDKEEKEVEMAKAIDKGKDDAFEL